MQIHSRAHDFIVHACLLMATVNDHTSAEAAELRGTIFGGIDVLRCCGYQVNQIEVVRDSLLADPRNTWEQLVEQSGPFDIPRLEVLLALAPPGVECSETFKVLTEWLTSEEVKGLLTCV